PPSCQPLHSHGTGRRPLRAVPAVPRPPEAAVQAGPRRTRPAARRTGSLAPCPSMLRTALRRSALRLRFGTSVHHGRRYGPPGRRRGRGMQTAPRVLFVGSYPPRRCGIATFTRDLAEGLAAVSGRPSQVIAVHNPADALEYPPEVVRTIRRDHIEDYREAAAFVNRAPVDVVCLQHEFGLFGGEAGAHLFEFLRLLEKPVVATLHTVIRRPAPEYREATLALIRHA